MVASKAATTPLPRGRWRPENFVAGDPALELVNTISHRRDVSLAEDRIANASDLADWALSLGLDAGSAPIDRVDIARVRAVREAVHDAFCAVADGQEPPRSAVTSLLRAAAEGFAARGTPRLHATLAWRGVQALVALPPDRIGACPACGWLFLDTSKGGRRRWCAMATCGTTAKVRVFRARKGSEP